MPIKITCPSCKRTINASDKHAGRQVKCPGCGSPFVVPAGAQAIIPAAPVIVETYRPPVVREPDVIERPVPRAEATIVHHHKASGGAFRSGFGMMLGCLLAVVVFFFGGCLVMGLLTKGVVDAAKEASKNAERHRTDNLPKADPPAEATVSPTIDKQTPSPRTNDAASIVDRDAQQREEEKRREAEQAERVEREKVEAAKVAAIEDAKYRTWTSANGKFSTEAKIASFGNGMVTLQTRAGKSIKVAVDKLSDADQAAIAAFRKERK